MATITLIFVILIIAIVSKLWWLFVIVGIIIILFIGSIIYSINKKISVNKKDIICLDIETTGLQKGKNEILQIAIIDGNYQTLFYTYIKPTKRKRWPDAEKINHITPEMVADSPTLYEVNQNLISIIKKAKLIVGYNLDSFDIPFLEYHLNCNFNNRTCDLINYANTNHRISLSECCKIYNIKRENAHDSFGDVKATLECFYKMIAFKVINKYEIVE